MNFNNAIFESSSGFVTQLPTSNCPEIVFSGKSNVGKSSLINKIVFRKSLARTSSSPGKTATINIYKVNNIRLVDLPGYGYAKVSHQEKKRWSDLVEGYFNDNRDIRLVVQLIDMRHSPTENDINMINYMCERELPFIIVFTKSDKLNKTQKQKRIFEIKNELNEYDGITSVYFSAVTGDGIDEIRSIISSVID